MVLLIGFEPMTHGLRVRCSNQLSYKSINGAFKQIRTADLYLTKVALYQLSYKSVRSRLVATEELNLTSTAAENTS